jgi:hypothetical protein
MEILAAHPTVAHIVRSLELYSPEPPILHPPLRARK